VTCGRQHQERVAAAGGGPCVCGADGPGDCACGGEWVQRRVEAQDLCPCSLCRADGQVCAVCHRFHFPFCQPQPTAAMVEAKRRQARVAELRRDAARYEAMAQDLWRVASELERPVGQAQ